MTNASAIEVPKELDVMNHPETDMLFLGHRLNSFRSGWPYDEGDSKCTSQKIAEAGFFRSDEANFPDSVKCAVCLKELDGWEPTDDPMEEHRIHCLQCPFVLLNKPEHEWLVEDFLNLVAARAGAMTKWGEKMIQEAKEKSDLMIQKIKDAQNRAPGKGKGNSSAFDF